MSDKGELLRGWKAIGAVIYERLKIGRDTAIRRSQDILELPTWAEGGNVVAYRADIEKWCDEIAERQREN